MNGKTIFGMVCAIVIAQLVLVLLKECANCVAVASYRKAGIE